MLAFSITGSIEPKNTSNDLHYHRRQWTNRCMCWPVASQEAMKQMIQVFACSITGNIEPNDMIQVLVCSIKGSIKQVDTKVGITGIRVKSGKFGHQVNSDTHLQTV